jgi:hypothetical protein
VSFSGNRPASSLLYKGQPRWKLIYHSETAMRAILAQSDQFGREAKVVEAKVQKCLSDNGARGKHVGELMAELGKPALWGLPKSVFA